MQGLTEPDAGLASRLLQDVPFEQRLVGYRRRARWGMIRAHIYNFREAVLLLNDKRPMIEFADLEQWLRTALGDGELADHVAAAAGAAPSDEQRVLQVRALLNERLEQCRQVTA